jgi:hypothetical protein
MLETDELNERLSAAYRKANERIQRALDDAARRTEAVMSSTSGWLAAAKAAAAQSMLEAMRGECDVQVTRLIDAHLDAGEHDSTKVAEAVRARFLRELTAPGLRFVPSSGPEAAALTVVAVKHAAEFELLRDGIAAEVPGRLRIALDTRRSPAPGGLETTRPAHSRVLLAFLIVTLLLSLAGVSWLDVIRRAATLL